MRRPRYDRPFVATVVDALGRGGAEKIALSIVGNLDRQRYSPIMVTTREKGAMASDIRKDVEVVSLNRTHRLDIRAVKRCARFLDEKGVLLVHSHNHSSSYFCRVVRLFCRNKWKHVVHDHHGPVVGSRKMTILDRLFLRDVDYYIGVSQALAERATRTLGIPEERCLYLPNGVLMPEISDKTQDGKIRIIQVGRIEPVKNQLMALRTAAELKKTGFLFEWSFAGKVGDKRYYAQLKEFVNNEGLDDRVTFLGERNDVQKLVTMADIGVLTSAHEGLSVAVLEYMANGLPVVITEVGESAELIRKAAGGFIVPHNDHEHAAGKLAALIKHDDLRGSFGRHNRLRIQSEHRIETMVDRIMAVYDGVIGHV